MLQNGKAVESRNSLGIKILEIMMRISPCKGKRRIQYFSIISTFILLLLQAACIIRPEYLNEYNNIASIKTEAADLSTVQDPVISEQTISLNNEFNLPTFNDEAVITLNGGIPSFNPEEKVTDSYIALSELDDLGRCGAARACLGPELLTSEERGPIGMVKPSGWHTVRYAFIDGQYLYNRCHLIAYSLSGINADERNLITGTRFLNANSMLKIELKLLAYIQRSGNHVLYTVTPRYNGNDLLATGIQIEAWSIEDHGEGICLNEFCFNIQPGVIIDYASGESWSEEQLENSDNIGEDHPPIKPVYTPSEGVVYVLNKSRMRFHLPTCPDIQDIAENNRIEYFGSRDALIESDYLPCGDCKP